MHRPRVIGLIRERMPSGTAGYVAHVTSRTFNPEQTPHLCPVCNVAGVRRMFTIEEVTMDVLECAACKHLTIYTRGR